MNSSALIVFIENLLPGKVKTRLSAALGNDQAFEIYTRLLEHTLKCTKNHTCEKFVFYSGFIPQKDEWIENGFKPCLQHGTDLGERLLNASLYVFSRNFTKVVMIGSDCFELEKEQIEEAFEALDNKNAVIGPAANGGYYLLGTSRLYPFLFFNKSWNTPLLFDETVNELNSHQLSFSLLPVLTNVNVENDLPLSLREELFHPANAAHSSFHSSSLNP